MRAPGGRPTVAEIKSLRRQLAEAKADCDHYVDFMMKSSLCESCQKEREVFLRKLGAGKTLRMQLADLQSRYDLLREVIELPLLFYAGGKPNWNRWEEITGSRYVTTRIMCDAIRAALNDKGEKDEESKPV
jgi:hypothetical protein